MAAIKGLFITGTDTGVGKTFIGAGLARALYGQGLDVQPRKPAESGCLVQDGQVMPADGMAYHAAVNASIPLNIITPYRYQTALAPPQAAQREQRHVTLDQLQQAVLEGVGNHSFLLVEGAGGFYSPIAMDGLNADLASGLQLPVLIVAANRLGCINHILLTVEAAQHRNLAVSHIILNAGDDNTVQQSNLDALTGLVNVPLLHVPACGDAPFAPPDLIKSLLDTLY